MALNALMNMNSEAAVPILERTLQRRDECSQGLRKKAVFLLSQKRSPEVVDILLKVAKEDPSPDVREQAVFWLSNVRDERVVDLLGQMANNNSDPAIQEKAIFALSNTRSEKASTILRDVAQRETASKGAREQAIFWLGNRRDTSSTTFLRGLYTRLTDNDLKEKRAVLRLQPTRRRQRRVVDRDRDQRKRVDGTSQAGALLGRQQQGGDHCGNRRALRHASRTRR